MDLTNQFVKRQVVRLKYGWIYQHLKKFKPLAAYLHLQNTFEARNGFLRALGNIIQGAFWNRARDYCGYDWEQGGVDFGDGDIARVFWQVALRAVCGFADFVQSFVVVASGGEFQLDTDKAFGRVRAHAVQTLN